MKKIKYVPLLWKQKVEINCTRYKHYSSYFCKFDKNFFFCTTGKDTSKNKYIKCNNCYNYINMDTVPLSCHVSSTQLPPLTMNFYSLAMHLLTWKSSNNSTSLIFLVFILYLIFYSPFSRIRQSTYCIDKGYLKKKFNDIQKIYHPDKHARNEKLDQINEVSSYLNSAYQTLQNDVDRALYLLNIKYNYKISDDENMDDDEEFLAEIVQVNEEINNPEANISQLTKEYKDKYMDYIEKIKIYFENKDFENILKALKKLKFIKRILDRLQDL
ncbi:co-chaperone Hsc20 [Plasmodium gonderi]|uniref:Co-chaperone Hsc20 n=1 Tax=Plasmodium gonderi TaxID=77519 RepID=A0A1Y1JJQ1_PLAGO|nr:co-chaperone Hsc20 [Plasmodium gonderi]GAW80264.1 co-chaperone Hsc20 [Plasmodium gonderi]